ncbi:MAG: Ku protein [Methylotenera sp.]|uniref:non-homologous end joining protein Ku n=1 Tax=Methylotenera sp. TaxID=2051956 RepID=UPI00248A4729|nr:Ku protein [Methylotenera sp.]MDI1308858.1 Ku protein [Methylotenera sp.]
MPRALWKGAISFGLIHIPVDLYSAESAQQLDLDMLDKRDFAPIGYKRINKNTGKEVEWEHIVKGYEFEDKQYVVLSEQDIKRANPESTQTIDILSFIDTEEISPIYYEKPYYLTPAKGGDKVYALLRETLKKSGKIAIGQVVIRVKQHLAALIPIDDMIVLNLLRYPEDMHPMDEYKVPKLKNSKTEVSTKEVQMALSLVEGMSETWDPKQYKDNYRNDLLKLINKRIKSKQTKLLDDSEPPPVSTESNIVDIMALLKQSIESKNKKGSQQAEQQESGKKDKVSKAS